VSLVRQVLSRSGTPGAGDARNNLIVARVPYTTREGMKIQLDEALKQAPTSKVTVDNLIDDSIVREIEKEGFIDRFYGKQTRREATGKRH